MRTDQQKRPAPMTLQGKTPNLRCASRMEVLETEGACTGRLSMYFSIRV